jgi:hypothetical protein
MRFRLTSLSFGFGLLVGSLSIICYNFVSKTDQTICGSLASCNSSNIHPIKCLIEGRRKLNCLKDSSDVYLPFNKFIQKQFDVYGRIVDGKNFNSLHFKPIIKRMRRMNVLSIIRHLQNQKGRTFKITLHLECSEILDHLMLRSENV